MPHADNQDDKTVMFHPVEDSVITHPDTKEALVTFKLLGSCRVGMLCESQDVGIDAGEDVLGKLAEGDLTSGLKHSLVMMTSAFIIITIAQGLTI